MTDDKTTIQELKTIIKKFVDERDWQQFHNPKNLSMGIAAEAAELMELFMWCKTEGSFDQFKKKKQEVQDEASDILFMLLAFCNAVDIDITSALIQKKKETEKKYPVEKCKGKSLKYDEY